ncbi:hypothetical protein WSK_0118 [Novosphingobium sp. Rr 2-17]|nr:hypothetical protein WSK_0118 [Novosphingobium sp. Rr 2-17]
MAGCSPTRHSPDYSAMATRFWRTVCALPTELPACAGRDSNPRRHVVLPAFAKLISSRRRVGRETASCSTRLSYPAEAGGGLEPPTLKSNVVPLAFAVMQNGAVATRVTRMSLSYGCNRGTRTPSPVSHRCVRGRSTLDFRVSPWSNVIPSAFATALFYTSTCLMISTQSRISPVAKRAIVSNTASEKPPTFRMSARLCACVVPYG